MTNQDEINRWTKLAETITDGNWLDSDLICPKCQSPMIVFSYTRNVPPRYGLFIRCMSCKALRHFSLGNKPPNFRDDLVLPEYQKLENEAIRFASE